MAARLEPRVSTLFGVAFADLFAIGERIRVEDPRRVFTLFDFRHVGLRVPDATIVGFGVVQILILQEPGDAVGLLNVTMVVVDVGRRILEARAVALRKDVTDIEAGVNDRHRASGQGNCAANVVGVACVALTICKQGNCEIAMATVLRRVSLRQLLKKQLMERIASGSYPASGVLTACDRVAAAKTGAIVLSFMMLQFVPSSQVIDSEFE